MNLLCPTDFSQTATNACEVAVQLLRPFDEKKIHLLHCINLVSRAGVFLKMDEMMKKQAREDLEKLSKILIDLDPEIEITTSVVSDNPKTYIPRLAEKESFDLIVTGTEGLSALKEVTIGSVTEFIIRKSSIPVLAIPPDSSLETINTMAIGLEDGINIQKNGIDLLNAMAHKHQSYLVGINVRPADAAETRFDMDQLFPSVNTEFHSVEIQHSVARSLAEFVSRNQIDLLTMVHKKKNWLERLFYSSITRAELFKIDFPLLVLPG